MVRIGDGEWKRHWGMIAPNGPRLENDEDQLFGMPPGPGRFVGEGDLEITMGISARFSQDEADRP